MREAAGEALTERLAQLDPQQLSRLVAGLQQRIDDLRATTRRARAPVAIVGLACRFPGAQDAKAFAALQAAAVDAVGPPPAGRPEAEGLPHAGYVEGIDRFDAGFFGLRPSEAEAMDPQHRMLLEESWHALEDAGYAAASRRPRDTGVFYGLATSDYEVRFRGESGLGVTPAVATGTSRSIAAGRVAHLLDSTGPAMVVDTACSSSLVAVHHAVAALRDGSCSLALAGGANALIEPDLSRSFEQAGMLSPTCACRTFDADADGYVRGEGCGVVVLKLLDDALRDGDAIRAIIRGSAVNHDGRASAITAPNGAAQTAVIRAALADAGIEPSEVQAVECHGTGTALGDPIEVAALAEAYGSGRTAPLLLGAVKSNIGHLEAAAGIAGLIRLVLALEAGVMPAVLHQRSPNPRIDWERLPLQVAATTQPWPEGARRRAGVSSFGFSGSNAHLILEEAPPATPGNSIAEGSGCPSAILPLSAPDRAGLARLAEALTKQLEAGNETGKAGFGGLARTFAIGRPHHRQRAAIPLGKTEDVLANLRAVAAGEPLTELAETPAVAPKIAFVFTGQGSQWRGMGRDLYESDEAFRATVDHCATRLGVPLARIMFQPGEEEELEDTRLAQPALFVLEYALAEWLEHCGVMPDLLLGHSLGEWVAACRAGVIGLDDALTAVAARGRLMGELPRDGGMAAVFAGDQVVVELIAAAGGLLDIAAVNAPEEVVVSGENGALAALCRAADARGIGTQPLRVSHAFHSRLMAPAAEAFAEELVTLALAPPRVGMISTLSGTTRASFDEPDYWVRQIREPVRFADGIATALAAGATVFVEVGPSPLLLGMARRVPGAEREGLSWVPTLRRGRPATPALSAALAQLYTAGVGLSWERLLPMGPACRGPLYPFADERYWIERPARPEVRGSVAVATGSAPLLARSELSEPASPEFPVETELREAASSLLSRSLQMSREQLEKERSFLESGVDSLALSEAVAAIEKRWSVRIPRRALFETLTTPPRLLDHVVAVAKQAGSPGSVTVVTPAAPVNQFVAGVAGAPGREAAVAPSALVPEEARVRAYLAGFARDFVARSRASRAQREIYGGPLADSRASAGFRLETKQMLYPIVGVSGKGGRMRDPDGNDYVDITMGFGVQLFGHHPPFVVEALRQQLDTNGLYLGPQAPIAGEVAAAITRITGTGRTVFCNSGTEAVMTALRVARHVTGRRTIAMFAGSYHGHFDGTLGRAAAEGTLPSAGGITQGMVADTVVLDYGNPEESLRTLQTLAPDLAAVIVEPVQSRNPGLQPLDFLAQLRAFTREAGAALIFDEVLLGFRVALGGAQAWAGVAADIVTYGKIVGGGLPIGVVAGDARYLDAIDGGAWSFAGNDGPTAERTFFAGTFNKNPLVMTAAKAVLNELETAGPALQQRLNERTEAFAQRLDAILADEGAPIRVSRFSSLFRFTGASDLFYHHMLCNGVYVWEGRTCFLSTAHRDADLDRVAEAVGASVRAMRGNGLLPAAGVPVANEQRLPLTPGQEALWSLAAFSPETASAYNQSVTLTLEGDCGEAAVREAVHAVVRRHDALRTTFTSDGTAQLVHAVLEPDFGSIDLVEAGDVGAERYLRQEAARPFDLERGPLFRIRLARVGAERYCLMLAQPHILTDGWSMQLIACELGALYSAKVAGDEPLLPPPAPWASYVAHTLERLQEPAARAYWLETFADPPPLLDLPLSRPRPPLQTYAGAIRRLRLPAASLARAEERARTAGCSLFALSLAVYGRLLAKLGGQNDMTIAIFSAGQPEIGERTLAGYCIATLPLRLRGAGSAPAALQLAAVQTAVSRAREHRDYPFAYLVRALDLRRDPSRTPLASVAFNLDRLDAEPRFEGLEVGVEANTHGSVRWDLTWNMLSDSRGLLIEAHYNSDLFEAEQVDGWLADYAALFESLLDESEDEVSPPQPARVETLAARAQAHALASPALAALRDREGFIDYAGLDRSAAALAAQLRLKGVGRGDVVAFLLPRGLGPVVAMLAAGRLGAAFVPLDPEHPPAQQARILTDSQARVLVVHAGWQGAETALPVVEWCRNQAGKEDTAAEAVPDSIAPAAEETAYILYTSGSSGEPKGVRVSFGNVAVYTGGLFSRLGEQDQASFAIVTSFAADLGYTAVFGALWSGGTLHVPDAETVRDPVALADFFKDAPVDYLKIVPTHFAALLEAPDAGRLLPRRALIFGGDVLPWRLVERVRSLGGSCRIFNHYGPTETTVGATMIEVTAALREQMYAGSDEGVPIGRALESYEVAIVDAEGRPVATGVEGEIRISGAAVALGYTRPENNRDAKGQTRFGCDEAGRRSYRTGDIGVMTADGIVTFRGRADEMVKIRGYRVEPAGLAAVIGSHPGVSDAAVLVERPRGAEPSLMAAVATSLDQASIAAWVAERVPAAMRPARILICESLPVTANGKIDRAALLARLPAAPEQGGSEGAATSSELEAGPVGVLQRIWQEALGRGPVAADDDFFEIGGDSIVAIQIVGKARAEGLRITPAQVFAEPTPRRLAALAEPLGSAIAGGAVVPGPLPLTPIQAWFHGLEVSQRSHWCLTALFEAPVGTSAQQLIDALARLVVHHDALRICLVDDPAMPRQALLEEEASWTPAVVVHDAGAAEGNALVEAEDALCNALMETIDLFQGPVIAGGLLLRECGTARIAIAVHHFVFDMVSWSILAEDLGDLLGQKTLRPATTRWSWWAARQEERTASVEAELDYWRLVEAGASTASRVPAGREGETRTKTLFLDAAATTRMLETARSAYGLQRHEVVLAAVGQALLEWLDCPSLALVLESHGREPFDPAVDLSRTLGWFTAHYPLVLDGGAGGDLHHWLLLVKERLRAVPNRGVGYGLLRQQPDSGLSFDPEVAFNFVGELAQFGNADLCLLRLGAGCERDPRAARPHRLSIDAWLDQGALVLACRHGPADDTAAIGRLLSDIREALSRIAVHCAQTEHTVYTPSDFSSVDFSQDELDALMADLGDL